MSGILILPLSVLAGLLCVAVAVAVTVRRRQRQAEAGPRCGNCGYNLTGAIANRCSECGKLFIDVGVITKHQTSPSRPAARVMLLVLAGVAGLGFLAATAMVIQTRAVRAQAMAARQAAVQAQAQTQAQAQAQASRQFMSQMLQPTTTAPATQPTASTTPANSAERP